MDANTTYIVVLNWNGWQDTIACLQSCLSLTGCQYRLVVCDNGSSDGSLEKIGQWAAGQCKPGLPDNPRLAALLNGRSKPNSVQQLKREDVFSGVAPPACAELIIIDNAKNLGFAAGNNSGVFYAMEQKDMGHVWLLNNDTLVEPDALSAMLLRMSTVNKPCVVGSLIKFYDNPAVIQAIGGNSYNKYTGIASESLGRYLPENSVIDLQKYEQKLDYICGASMLLSNQYLDDIGLMEERYFLYYEEINWATRSRHKYALVVALDSVVYHKEGSAIGSASLNNCPSPFSEFYKTRAKLSFTWQFYPYACISCYVFSLLQIINRLRKGRLENAKALTRGLLKKRTYKA